MTDGDPVHAGEPAVPIRESSAPIQESSAPLGEAARPAGEPDAPIPAVPAADATALTTLTDQAGEGWRRLSVRMLLVHPVQELRRAIIPLLVLIVFGRGDRNLWPYAAVLIVVALGLIRWFTTTYRVTPTQIQVRRGLLGRSTLSVPRDRVRTVDVTSHLMHRVLGLARITIGTGQTDRKKEDGLRLDALTTEAAVRLRNELLHEGRHVRSPRTGNTPATVGSSDAPPRRLIARLDPAWVRYAPFTLSGLVTIGVFAGFLANVVNQAHVNPANVGAVRTASDDLAKLPLVFAVIVVLLIVIVIVSLLSAGGYLLAFWDFQLTRDGATLHVTRGLLTTRATTIEARRLRGAEISEPILLRRVRGARAIAITTGLRVGRGAERGGSVLLPAAPAEEVDRVVADVIETSAPPSVALIRHGPRARRRRINRALLVTGVLTAVLIVLWWFANWPIGFPVGGLVIFLLALPVALDRYRNLGHALGDGFLVTRQGSLVRRRYMLATAGIIGWNERMSFFQRRAGLVTLIATTAAGRQHYDVLDLAQSDAIALADAATPGLLTPFLTTSVDRPASAPQPARRFSRPDAGAPV
ncbi:MAG TPA: PH domain-containing protein [Micromonosporaceae bacterium]|nr:PH domain-containing protein [Micromonosporaceae bacterium]